MSTNEGPSTRISRRFSALHSAGELGLVAYITAGDPSMAATLEFVLALEEAGTDVIELGVPFSDPLADGPTIQRASERALKAGASLAELATLNSSMTNDSLEVISLLLRLARSKT